MPLSLSCIDYVKYILLHMKITFEVAALADKATGAFAIVSHAIVSPPTGAFVVTINTIN